MNLLMKCAGLECRFAVGTAGKTKEDIEKHAWNQVKIGNDWYNVDATWDDPIGGEDVLTHMYFNVSDAALSETHTWEEQGHVKCSAMRDNYYYHNGSYVDNNNGLEVLASVTFADPTVTDLECAIGPNVAVDNDSLVFFFPLLPDGMMMQGTGIRNRYCVAFTPVLEYLIRIVLS
jgi:transglutaminase-like putative cysteine protease